MASATAHLPNGNHLFYLDSGPVPDSDNFTTVITFHGMSFNAHGFERVLTLAHKHNIRLVVVQRKDYAGSSRFTDQEMDSLIERPGDFLAEMGAVIAQFVHYLVVNTRVCKPTKEHSEGGGGITIMGWSLGCLFAMTIFAKREVLDKDAYALIEPYVTNLVLYDPPHDAMGVTFTDLLGEPGFEPPVYDRTKKGPLFDVGTFHIWATCYFDHPEEWDGTPDKLDRRPRTDDSGFESWSDAEKERFTEEFGIRSDIIILHRLGQTYVRPLAETVLWSTDTTHRAFPLAQVTFIHGKRSIYMAVLAWYAAKKIREDLLRQGHGSNLRPMKFKAVEYGNHFIHLDHTNEFMEILSESIKSSSEAKL